MLFGHQNDDTNQPTQTVSADPVAGVNPLAVDPATGASLPVAPAEPPSPPEPSEPSVLNQPATPFNAPAMSLPAPDVNSSVNTSASTDTSTVQPTVDDSTASFDATDQPFADPTASTSDKITPPEGVSESQSDHFEPMRADSSRSSSAPSGDLLSLKQQALTQLEPLVNQLDQTPEEKFRTTMMLIQSTDNQSLIQAAYDTAQSIPDEKIRAQALLDVINEINYFTQQQSKD